MSSIFTLTIIVSPEKPCELCQHQEMIHSWSALFLDSSRAMPDTSPLVYSLLPACMR